MKPFRFQDYPLGHRTKKMIDTMEHAEEEAGREYWREPIFACPDCGQGISGERDRCPRCEIEHLAAHQLTYPNGSEFIAAAMKDVYARFKYREPIPGSGLL